MDWQSEGVGFRCSLLVLYFSRSYIYVLLRIIKDVESAYVTLEVTADRETAIRWAQENFLLYNSRQCQQHRCEMRYYINRGCFGTFRCPKNKNYTSGRPAVISAATGTWFAGHHIDASKAFSLMMRFCDNDTNEEARRKARFDDSDCSSETICDWYSYCREVIVEKFLKQQ